MGATAFATDPVGGSDHGLRQCLSVLDRPQGVLPRAGYRPFGGSHPGGPRYLVPGDAAETFSIGQPRHGRPGGGYRCRINRRYRREQQHGADVRVVETLGRAEGQRRPSHRAAAPQTFHRTGREPVSAGRPRHSRWWTAE